MTQRTGESHSGWRQFRVCAPRIRRHYRVPRLIFSRENRNETKTFEHAFHSRTPHPKREAVETSHAPFFFNDFYRRRLSANNASFNVLLGVDRRGWRHGFPHNSTSEKMSRRRSFVGRGSRPQNLVRPPTWREIPPVKGTRATRLAVKSTGYHTNPRSVGCPRHFGHTSPFYLDRIGGGGEQHTSRVTNSRKLAVRRTNQKPEGEERDTGPTSGPHKAGYNSTNAERIPPSTERELDSRVQSVPRYCPGECNPASHRWQQLRWKTARGLAMLSTIAGAAEPRPDHLMSESPDQIFSKHPELSQHARDGSPGHVLQEYVQMSGAPVGSTVAHDVPAGPGSHCTPRVPLRNTPP